MTSGYRGLVLALALVCSAASVQGLGEGIVQFEGMSFHREGDANLTVYLAIEGKDGAVHEEAFRYARARSGKQ